MYHVLNSHWKCRETVEHVFQSVCSPRAFTSSRPPAAKRLGKHDTHFQISQKSQFWVLSFKLTFAFSRNPFLRKNMYNRIKNSIPSIILVGDQYRKPLMLFNYQSYFKNVYQFHTNIDYKGRSLLEYLF